MQYEAEGRSPGGGGGGGGGAQGARAPPLSCRAMTLYEHCLATHVVTLTILSLNSHC